MTDLERLLKLVSVVADDGFASSAKGLADYRNALLTVGVNLLGFTPEFVTDKRAAELRRRRGPSGDRCLGDALREDRQ